MNIYTLDIGLFDKDTLKQEIPKDDVIDIISDYFDCSIQEQIGIYTHSNGVKIIEPSLHVTVYNTRGTQLYWTVKELCKKLNQESIVVNEINVEDTKFIGGE